MTKISELTSIVTAAATDIIAVVQGGVTKKATIQDYRDAGIIPTADQAAALAAYEAALAAAEADQVLTASGPGAAAFAPAGGASLSDYSNVIVVDAGGNGDYTTLSAAVAAANDGDTIFVFGRTTETDYVLIGLDVGGADNQITVFLTAGAVVDAGEFGVYISYNAAFLGPGSIVGAISSGLLAVYGGSVSIDCLVINSAGYGVSLEPQAAMIIRMQSHRIEGSLRSLNVVGPANISAGSLFTSCNFIGPLRSNVAWSNAPFYHCRFNGTVTNITANSGTANGTNVVI